MEIWDGYHKNGSLAGVDLIRGLGLAPGIYHLVCEVLVQHEDGDYLLMQRDENKVIFPSYFEATAGGAALKGENPLACIQRELLEETGIESGKIVALDRFVYDDDQCFFHTFICRTAWDKEKIKLQKGETVAYKWVDKQAFIDFCHSDQIVPGQKERYADYLKTL